MAKLLKGVHVVLLVALALYAGKEIIRWVTKILNPSDEYVRFWRPGPEIAVTALSFLLLLGILACSLGVVKIPSWRLLITLQGLWLICFTWFGWFSAGAPFRLHELVRVDLTDASAVGRAGMIHLLQTLAVYLIIVFISAVPLLLRWFGRCNKAGRNSPGNAPNPILHR